VTELTVETHRRTELVDITSDVRPSIAGSGEFDGPRTRTIRLTVL
jgi:hypothetical protein